MNIRLGTRGSRLALAQCAAVKTILEANYPMHTYEICVISTLGDRDQQKALDAFQDKGIFVKEIEAQLLNGQIDMAIHSMKDMPAVLPQGLIFTKTLLREDARDVIVLNRVKSIADLPPYATIGTGSKRRKYQLLQMRKDFHIVGLRGNLDTRLQKMKERQLDGIVVAAAGLHRLHLQEDVVYEYLPQSQMVPAAAQGAIAIEIKQNHCGLLQMVNSLCDDDIEREVQIERQFMKLMNGGCHSPIGARCRLFAHTVSLDAVYGNEDGSKLETLHIETNRTEWDTLAKKAAADMKQKVSGV